MAEFTEIPTRNGNDSNSFTDINNLMDNDDYLKDKVENLESDVVSVDNRLINSNFDVWDMGTSATSGVFKYLPTNWAFYRDTGNATGATFTRQSSGATAGSYYFSRLKLNNSTPATKNIHMVQGIETRRTLNMHNKSYNLQLKLKQGTAWTPDVQIALLYSTTEDDTPIHSSFTNISSATLSLSNTWTMYELTGVSIPTASNTLMVDVKIAESATGATDAYVDISQVQLYENYSTGVNFNPPDPQTEIDICRKYLYRTEPWDNGGTPYDFTGFCLGYTASADYTDCLMEYPSPMITYPSFTYSNNNLIYALGGTYPIINYQFKTGYNTSSVQAQASLTPFSGNTGRVVMIRGNVPSDYLQFDAQL